MGIFSRLFNSRVMPLTKSSDFASLMLSDQVRGGTIRPGNYESMARNGFMRNSTVYSSAIQISRAAGSVPWSSFSGPPGDETRERIDHHPALDLWRRPNPSQGISRFVEELFLYLHIAGEAFVATSFHELTESEEARRGAGKLIPDSLILLRPNRVSFPDDNPSSDIIWTSPNGRSVVIPRADVLHMKFFHPLDDVRGLSPIEVAKLSIEQANVAKRWNNSLLRKAGRPGGILKSRATLPASVQDKLLDRFNSVSSGADHAGDTLFLTGEVDWERQSLSPEEVSWVEGQKLSVRDIAVTEGAPSQLVGDTESSTYANYQEARKALYQERVLPLLCWVRDEVNVWLMPRYGGGVWLDFLKKEIDALQEDRASEWARIESATWMSVNEKRMSVGLDPVSDPDADIPMRLLGDPIDTSDPIELSSGISSSRLKSDRVIKQSSKDPEDASRAEIEEILGYGALGSLFFNIDSQAQVEFHWRTIEMGRQNILPSVRKRIGDVFKLQARAVVGELLRVQNPQSVLDHMDLLLSSTVPDFKEALEGAYGEVARTFARSVTSQLPETRIPENFVLSNVLHDAQLYLEDIIDEKISGIHKHTSERIKKSIVQSMDDGKSTDDIAQAINTEFSDSARIRRISQTETAAASNIGAQRAAVHSGFEMRKKWIATLDSRVRDAHAFAHGQERGIEEPYLVGGEPLQFPGDSTFASSSNVANCRCSESYIVD